MKGDYKEYKTQTTITSWETLKSNHPQIASSIGYWKYRRFLSDMSDMILEEIIKTPLGFELPLKMGVFQLVGYKPFKNRPAGSPVRTEGYVYKMCLHIGQKRTNISNYDYFKFETSKVCKTYLRSLIKLDKFFQWVKVDRYVDIKHLRDIEVDVLQRARHNRLVKYYKSKMEKEKEQENG